MRAEESLQVAPKESAGTLWESANLRIICDRSSSKIKIILHARPIPSSSGHHLHLHLHLHRIAQSASPPQSSFIFIRGPFIFIFIHLCLSVLCVSLCRSHLLIKRASRKGGCLIKEGGSDCYHFLRCCVSLLFFKAHTRFQREP